MEAFDIPINIFKIFLLLAEWMGKSQTERSDNVYH